jgi:CheY-like chemotaxis protein
VTETILLAEDDRFLRRAMEVTLIKRGYKVITAADGVQALERATAELPDLILLDLLMPRLTGIEVLQRLRANPATRHITVLVLSNSSKEFEMQSAESLGIAGYWIKANLSLQELSDRVARTLSERRTEPQ